jgi:hypothetical protein
LILSSPSSFFLLFFFIIIKKKSQQKKKLLDIKLSPSLRPLAFFATPCYALLRRQFFFVGTLLHNKKKRMASEK